MRRVPCWVRGPSPVLICSGLQVYVVERPGTALDRVVPTMGYPGPTCPPHERTGHFTVTLRELFTHLTEDWEAHGRPFPLASAGFQTVALYRFGRWAAGQPAPWRHLLLGLQRVASILCRNLYGIELPLDVEVGRRLWIGHQSGVVVGHGVVIGDDCLIRQNVTIGADQHNSRRPPPRLGDRVEIGAGAVILGGVTVGDDVRIGPNSVVMKSVPAGGSAFAAPARVMQPLRASQAAERT